MNVIRDILIATIAFVLALITLGVTFMLSPITWTCAQVMRAGSDALDRLVGEE